MSEEIAAYARREIDELDHLDGRQYLQDLGTPKLVKYRSNGYAVYDCWLVSQVAESDFYLCVVVGQLSDVRRWGLLEYQNGEYSMVSYGVSDLHHMLEDAERMIEDD
ncbi:MAG: hypothetical protein AAGF33_02755 [Pseudomonadota bacterium]